MTDPRSSTTEVVQSPTLTSFSELPMVIEFTMRELPAYEHRQMVKRTRLRELE